MARHLRTTSAGDRRRRPFTPADLVPPGAPAAAALAREVAAVTAGRLRRAARSLEAIAATPPGRRPGPGAGAHRPGRRGPAALAALVATTRSMLAGLPVAQRRRFLCGPDLRGFLSEAETWVDVLRFAARGAFAVPALFDRISRTEHLPALVPTGRVDAGFPARARRLALLRLQALESDLGAFMAGLALACGPETRRVEVVLRPREEAEQGRPADRIDLGAFGGPAGPLGLRAAARRRAGAPLLRVRVERGLLTVRAAVGPAILVPAAGSPLASPHPILVRRRCIPGTTILLAPALRSGPRRLGVGRDMPGLHQRLARALRLVRLAWPEAHRDIAARTAMVVPVREPGLVSYSLAARPGISFINVHGKRIIQLADDLLHENAHHLLHDAQETAVLLTPGPETEEVQAFHSPWRGTLRPLHGILHGTFTFLFRAALFARILEAHAGRPRVIAPLLGPGGAAFVRRELRREIAMLGRGLSDLETAMAHRLLTPAGRDLAAALASWHRSLRRGAAPWTRRRHPTGSARRTRRARWPTRGGR